MPCCAHNWPSSAWKIGFSVIVNSADFGEAKPHPGIFLEGVKLLGAVPERVLYVGDDLHNDYFGAQQVGLHAILLNRDSAPVPKGVRAIATLNDLPGLIGSTLLMRSSTVRFAQQCEYREACR